MSTAETTPLMKQYHDLKAQAGDALLLFRMGDFYELFGDDAVVASRILEITLTSRDKNSPNPMPMAGVPHHSIQNYLQRLLAAGKKVAIGEQVEDPATAKGIVRREITRVFTPAVQFDLEGSETAYLATSLRAGTGWVLACLEPSTGDVLVSETLDHDALLREISALPLRHFLHLPDQAPEAALREISGRQGTLLEELPSNYLSLERATEAVKTCYAADNLDAYVQGAEQARALGILLHYALRTQQQERLGHLRAPRPLRQPTTLVYGPRTPQHLDLLPTPDGAPNVFSFVNRTRSALGGRQLRRWLLEPLKDPDEILYRQAGVREASQDRARAEGLGSLLSEVYDLERILGRVNTSLANPRDTLALARSTATLERASALLGGVKTPSLRRFAGEAAELARELAPLTAEILRTQREDAPLVSREGGIFNRGTDPELDRLLTLTEDGERWLIELEAREREATGISSLKVRYNRVFGYYIEITKTNLKSVPAHYQRKQSMANAERFFTEELKKFEDEILNASSRRKALEQQLFEALLGRVRASSAALMQAARLLGELDALLSLSRLAQEPGWVFPQIDASLDMEIEAGRHPLVDSMARGAFVPNDMRLSPDSRLVLLITGPNMGGKSTVMRQTALIVILGQMGAPVPAARARWGAVSSLYTRIGAHDSIARGQSTFMVEMGELAHILHHADERALIILDEIGRGTSTYDGISVAWATVEWLCKRIKARTLFATHYHELTRLESRFRVLKNAHMAVDGAKAPAIGGAADGRGAAGASLRFLYKLREGAANESFGIHVARLAGLPSPIIERAWKVLDELEKGSSQGAGAAGEINTDQLSFFDLAGTSAAEASREEERAAAPAREPEVRFEPHPALDELRDADLDAMTPLQAMNFLAAVKERLAAASSPGA